MLLTIKGSAIPLLPEELKEMRNIRVCIEDWTKESDSTIQKHQRFRYNKCQLSCKNVRQTVILVTQ